MDSRENPNPPAEKPGLSPEPCGLYLHIPFCRTRCNYCHFVTRRWNPHTVTRYRDALLREIELFFASGRTGWHADSVYFGGGTPSLVPVLHIRQALEILKRCTAFAERVEATLEANPGTVAHRKAIAYRRLGINRVSLGAQTFDDAALAAIGRDHTGDEVEASVASLRSEGIRNINLDLMLGLPNQDKRIWMSDLERTVRIGPTHVSVYMLDLDDHAPLFHLIRRGRLRLPEEEEVADLYEQTCSYLSRAGYRRYEISNFALDGFESRHNLKYWRRRTVLGFGVGSHSFDGMRRFANHAGLAPYLEAVESGRSPIEWQEALTPVRCLQEELFLGLRLAEGIDWGQLLSQYGSDSGAKYSEALRSAELSGLLTRKGSRLSLTASGVLLSNELFQHFVD